MFTGIIQAVGEVKTWSDGVLQIDPKNLDVSRLELGESIAINGVCLTVVRFENGLLQFDLSPETVQVSSFGTLAVGFRVNLERAMALGDRLGGHIVQGHVDGVGKMLSKTPSGNSTVFRFQIPNPRYVIEKGSITINGVSLTVVKPERDEFDVWVIPHTIQNTSLGELQPGESVNIEYDMIAKYVERLTSYRDA
jgi:riboflavin synthase